MRSFASPGLRALACALPSFALIVATRSTPVVGLNHLTLVPDSATFAAILASPFLRDTFALVDVSPADRAAGGGGGGGTAGVALFGRSTYVEFRRPGTAGGGTNVATSGLTLGTDQRGALRTVAERLTSEVGPVRFDSVTRRRDSADVPWFYQIAASDAPADSMLAVRVMEYHPQFLRSWYGTRGAAAAVTSVARADVLAMHASGAGVTDRRRYPFIDIVGIKIAAPEHAEALLLGHCRAVGWRVQTTSGGSACVGSGVRLFVVPAERARGIVAFTMRVTPSSKLRGAATRTFGRSTLRISRNGFATWEFGQAQD